MVEGPCKVCELLIKGPPTTPIKFSYINTNWHEINKFINKVYSRAVPPPFCKQKGGIGFAILLYIEKGFYYG